MQVPRLHGSRGNEARLDIQEAAECQAEQVQGGQDLAEQLVHARGAERAGAPAQEEQRQRRQVRLHAVGLPSGQRFAITFAVCWAWGCSA